MQFDPLPIKNAHLGDFWSGLDANEWPTVSDAPLIPTQFERFTEEAKWADAARVSLTQDPSCRLQIKNQQNDRMIQIQKNRFHFNWIKVGETDYPRYENVLAGLISTFERFIAYIAERDLGEIRPNQWEVTYINHIPQGTLWNNPSEWGFFNPLSGIPSIPEVIEGESFGGQWHFVIPEKRGRLHIAWQHGLNPQPTGEVIRLNLTASRAVQRRRERG